MDIFAEFPFRDAVNRLVRVWKNPYIKHTYCAGHRSRWSENTAADSDDDTLLQGEQSSTIAVAKVQTKESQEKTIKMGQKNRNRRANMSALWRQRNLRSRWRALQYKEAT